MRIVIALGGNAMTGPRGEVGPVEQQAAVEKAAAPVADVVAAGHEVVLTHGNGPQVGDLLRMSEIAAGEVPPVPLDWCGAQTQGTIGKLLLDALDVALAERGVDTRTATLVSRTLVDPADPAFRHPTKPIGRLLSREAADVLVEHGQEFVEVPGKGWRRVVPSPEPQASLDAPAALALLAAGFVVVCSGGGGVPTVRQPHGQLSGIEAVIDKDLTAALVATHVEAGLLVIATDVEAVLRGFGTPQEEAVGEVTAREMRAIAEAERFPAGSMGPKVEAVVRFAEAGGTGVIASLDRLGAALEGTAGTRVVPDGSR